MTAPIVIFTEEPSARIVIDQLCKARDSVCVQVLEHAGKSDLERSIKRKIHAWRSPTPTHFIITRDLDGGNRAEIKAKLMDLVPEHSRARTKIRLVVPELEAWYLGDPTALFDAGLISLRTAQRIRNESRFRNLCTLKNAKFEFKKIVGSLGQINAASQIAPMLIPERNSSLNFRAFIAALGWAETEAQKGPALVV